MRDTIGNVINPGDLVIYKKHVGSYNYAVAVVKETNDTSKMFHCFEAKSSYLKTQGPQAHQHGFQRKVFLGESRLKQVNWKIIARLERPQVRWILDKNPSDIRTPQDVMDNNRMLVLLFGKQDEILKERQYAPVDG